MATKKTTTVRRTTRTVGQSAVLSIVDWLVTLIILAIPLVGLIMAFVWAFGGGGNHNRRNFARASLILMAVAIVLGLVFGAATRSLFGSYLNLINGA